MVRLGFQSAILGDLSFDEVITFASDNGFSYVEIMCWPVGKSDRRYAGVTHIDVASLDDNEITRIKNKLKEKNVTERHSRRPNQYIIGCCSIQYDEMDEIKTTRNIEFNFSLNLPDTYFSPGKYPTLENKQKTKLIRIN